MNCLLDTKRRIRKICCNCCNQTQINIKVKETKKKKKMKLDLKS